MPETSSSHRHLNRVLPLWEGRTVLIATGLFLTFLTAMILIFPPLLVRQAELRMYDLMLSARTSPPKSNLPILVGIDEESLNAFGQWPWPRYRLARLVERLNELGAKVVALDFLMPEFDRTSPEVIISERKRDLEATSSLPASELLDSNSRRLAAAMSRGETALAYFFDFSGQTGLPSSLPPVIPTGMLVIRDAGSDPSWPKPKGIIRSIPLLAGAVRAEGFTNALHDLDGALRRVPLLLPQDGKLYPSLALATLLLTSPERRLRISHTMTETTLIWGDRHIPLDREGNMLIDYRDEKTAFPYFSAKSVLDDRLAPGSLQGKIVLVGPWAKGLGDYHLAPSGKSFNGLTIHATIIDNLLSESFIRNPGWAKGAELFAVLLLGGVSSWLLSRPGFILALVTVTAGIAGCYLAGVWLLVSRGVYISPLIPMLTPPLVMTFLSLLKYGIEARKVRQRTLDLIKAQNMIIVSMSSLTETRDMETGGHILRTQRYVESLARHLATLPKYRDLDNDSIELLTISAPLHDIGKVGIPDSILHKPGKLTDNEYAVMKNHTLIGVHALTMAMDAVELPEQHDFLLYAQQMIESHHERWDGSGYPHGLKGEDIPLAGRLMALADAYDALVSRRVYKRELSHECAVEQILDNAGTQFDPDIVVAFTAINEEFLRIATVFADKNRTPSNTAPFDKSM